MKLSGSLAVGFLFVVAGTAGADEIDGLIERVDLDRKTFIVDGITFHVTQDTAFEDGLEGFIDLVRGLHVEVDYELDNRRYIATEIERED